MKCEILYLYLLGTLGNYQVFPECLKSHRYLKAILRHNISDSNGWTDMKRTIREGRVVTFCKRVKNKLITIQFLAMDDLVYNI